MTTSKYPDFDPWSISRHVTEMLSCVFYLFVIIFAAMDAIGALEMPRWLLMSFVICAASALIGLTTFRALFHTGGKA